MAGDGSARFRSAHDALTFAFRHSTQQHAKTAMSALMQGGPLGRGLGLHGLDGAAQAGMILAAMRALTQEQRALLTVRYGNVPSDCPHCGRPTRSRAWQEALDYLSHCAELRDLPRPLRHAAVEKIVCRSRGISVTHWANSYDVNARTVRSRVAKAKQRLTVVENAALSWMSDHLEGADVIEPA
jgi:hypothetical protein